jgi:hypothetical protein
MARSTTDICLTLRPSTVQAVDAAAQAVRRSRSQYIDMLLSKALTGKDRLHALEEIAADSREAYHAAHTREKAPNATAVIAESCVEGRRRLDALNEIAKGAKR